MHNFHCKQFIHFDIFKGKNILLLPLGEKFPNVNNLLRLPFAKSIQCIPFAIGKSFQRKQFIALCYLGKVSKCIQFIAFSIGNSFQK